MGRSKTEALYEYDRILAREAAGPGALSMLAGCDEAGRGPLAGPVVAAAVVLDLDPGAEIAGINDSKRISAARRPLLYGAVVATARAWAVGTCSPAEIDEINILQASLLAMERALRSLPRCWELALVDGNTAIPGLDAGAQRTIVHGDALSASIAAASIVAKVTRDRIMVEYHGRFPAYGFDQHKGYPTAAHVAALRRMGPCEIHRRSFCERLTMQTELDLRV